MTELHKLSEDSRQTVEEVFNKHGQHTWAYAVVNAQYRGDGVWCLGAAIEGEAGYNPIPPSLCRIAQGPDAYENISGYADWLNHKLGHSDEYAAKIVLGTIGKQHERDDRERCRKFVEHVAEFNFHPRTDETDDNWLDRLADLQERAQAVLDGYDG